MNLNIIHRAIIFYTFGYSNKFQSSRSYDLLCNYHAMAILGIRVFSAFISSCKASNSSDTFIC